MKTLQISTHDVGITLQATLTFADFDPTGATAVLHVAEPRGRGRIPPRDMSLVGNVASYTVPANIDGAGFDPGYYASTIRVTKGAVTVTSEDFLLALTP
jgi:hypothetical protein